MERDDETLVEAIAQEYVGRCALEATDLVAVGRAGLARGRERMPEGDVQNTRAYLEWWVRWAITREIAERADTRPGGVGTIRPLPTNGDRKATLN